MSTYFTAPDGADEPTIWERTDGDPAVVVRRAELPGPHADLLWRVLTGVLCADAETVDRVARPLCNRAWLGLLDDDAPCADHQRDVRDVFAALREVR